MHAMALAEAGSSGVVVGAEAEGLAVAARGADEKDMWALHALASAHIRTTNAQHLRTFAKSYRFFLITQNMSVTKSHSKPVRLLATWDLFHPHVFSNPNIFFRNNPLPTPNPTQPSIKPHQTNTNPGSRAGAGRAGLRGRLTPAVRFSAV